MDDAPPLSYVAHVANDAKKLDVSSTETLPFETALKKLESIVEAMESGDLPLETLLEKYEEGSRMVKICQTKLEEAELKIQKLEKTAAGDFLLKQVDTGAAPGKKD